LLQHIKNNHTIKKLFNEVGFSDLISCASGRKGRKIVKQVLNSLSSTAFVRTLEKVTNMESVKYLLKKI
jgi:hypothetical protein